MAEIDDLVAARDAEWPGGMRSRPEIDSERSRKLGLERDKDLDEVVRNFIADDLDEQMKLVTPA